MSEEQILLLREMARDMRRMVDLVQGMNRRLVSIISVLEAQIEEAGPAPVNGYEDTNAPWA